MTEVNPNQETNSFDVISTGSGFKIKVSGNINSSAAKTTTIVDKTISSAVAPADDVTAIADDPVLTNVEKIDKLQDIIAVKQARLSTLTQKAAQSKCLDVIETARQYISLFKGDSVEDDDDDMDIFDVITYNSKLVALKKSNALIVTGDAGVGKTHSVKEAIQFLNPIRETVLVDVEDTDFTDGEDETETSDAESETPVSETTEEPKLEEPVVEQTQTSTGQPAFKIKINNGPKLKEVKTLRDSNNHVESGYVILKGTSSAAGLYELLFIHRHKLLIFDDFDSVLKDEDCVNYLKAALDTYAIREVAKMRAGNSFNSMGMTDAEMWDEYEITGKVPNQFRFFGNIIFISNIHEDKFDKALISRSLHVEVRLTKEQMISRMKSLMMDIRPECPLEWKLEALHHLEYLTTNFICKFDLNLRELIHFIDIRKGFPDDVVIINGKSVPLWKQLAKKRIVKSKIRRVS